MKTPDQPARESGAHARRPALDLDALAVEVLSFIASDPESLQDFLAETGLDPTQARRAAAQPQFLRGVLAFLIADEARLVAFSAAHRLDPESLGRAIMAADRRDFREDS